MRRKKSKKGKNWWSGWGRFYIGLAYWSWAIGQPDPDENLFLSLTRRWLEYHENTSPVALSEAYSK